MYVEVTVGQYEKLLPVLIFGYIVIENPSDSNAFINSSDVVLTPRPPTKIMGYRFGFFRFFAAFFFSKFGSYVFCGEVFEISKIFSYFTKTN